MSDNSFPSFGSYCKHLNRNPPTKVTDFAPRTLHLIAALIRCSQLGIAEEPEATMPVLHNAFKWLTHSLNALGVKNVDQVVVPMKWQHRPSDRNRMEWLDATSRMNSHAEIMATLCGNFLTGTAKRDTTLPQICMRLDQITDDLVILCGALKLAPRQIVESQTK